MVAADERNGAPPTGLDLQVMRKRAGLTQTDVSEWYGAGQGQISEIERFFEQPVPRKKARRYLAALAAAIVERAEQVAS